MHIYKNKELKLKIAAALGIFIQTKEKGFGP